MGAHLSGQSWAVLAASEMGKGVWLKDRLTRLKKSRQLDRLVIWDTNDEYENHATEARTLSDFRKLAQGPRFAVRYVPKGRTDKQLRAEFEAWCLLTYAAPEGTTIVVEELADVTAPSFAPPAWRRLNTRGRHHRGFTIYFCSQSPAFIDKASLGNATHMHIGYLGEPRHRVAAAAHMGCSADDIDALKQFEWIEYVKATKERTNGRVKLKT